MHLLTEKSIVCTDSLTNQSTPLPDLLPSVLTPLLFVPINLPARPLQILVVIRPSFVCVLKPEGPSARG